MSASKSKSGGFSGQSVDRSYSFVQNRKRYKNDSSSLDPVSDPNSLFNHHELGKIFSYEHLDVFDADVKLLGASYVHGNAKSPGENQIIEDYCTFHSKNDAVRDDWLRDLGSMMDDGLQRTPVSKDMEKFWFSEANLIDFDPSDCMVSERSKEHSSDLDSHFSGCKKVEPWWHTAEQDDSASLVSSEPNQTIQKDSADAMHFSEKGDKEAELSSVNSSARGNLASLSDKSHNKMGSTECIGRGSDGTISSNGSNTVEADSFDSQESTSGDLRRTKLLEALCHSQARAREAEKLAQEACDEKAHIIDLFFRQASYLFAYRQWLHMLQLETLCFRLRCKEHNSLTTPPSARSKAMVLRKKRRRATQKHLCKHICRISSCALAFAVGLGLAGAGLLVGWTVGWLFPSF